MKEALTDPFFLVEELAQEEAKSCRRSAVKNIVRNIRDWWNHLGELTPAEYEMELRKAEALKKYEIYRVQI